MFVNPGGDAAGGAERSLALLLQGLIERGHRAAVINLIPGTAAEAFARQGAEVLADGLGQHVGVRGRHASTLQSLIGMLGSAPSAAAISLQIRSLATAFDATLIHTNGLRAHVLTPFLLDRRRPVVWSLRDRPENPAVQLLLRTAARKAAAITAPSLWAASVVSHSRRPVYIIPNPVVETHRDTPLRARESLGLPRGRPVIAVVAHLHPTKGQHVAVQAWTLLDVPRPLLVLAGGDLYGEASTRYRQHIRSLIASEDLGDDVRLIGLVNEPADVYAVADILLHPAIHPEGFGRSIAEAQIAMVPVIATGIGAACELIDDDESGILVPPDDAVGIAAIARLLGSRLLYERLQKGGDDARLRYLPARHVAAMESVYRRVREERSR